MELESLPLPKHKYETWQNSIYDNHQFDKLRYVSNPHILSITSQKYNNHRYRLLETLEHFVHWDLKGG